MPTRGLKHISYPLLCALAAVSAGLLGGATAVHGGLQVNAYGDATTSTGAVTADATDAGCADCSERDLGYRWATMREVATPDQCPNDSWGFRRGCLDYAGGV